MHYYVAKHNINRFACLLTATLIQTSCNTLLSAKIRSTPGYNEVGTTVLPDRFDFPELIYCIGDLYRVALNISIAVNGQAIR